ncbi:monooxygenase 3 isoform X1 [Punica granatum]|uniref:Monooxygenase 3 isoform X1 n=3 Tax=Punica granatum TaxID=22663 RepID=A0A6P8E5C5_PUNGR|nr:monooxygenase 3 isoform X1 [Punica granatum]
MAAASSFSLHHWSRAVPLSWTRLRRVGNRNRLIRFCTVRAGGDVLKEDIVVVGAGIAGLATSLSLHRLGVKSLVLEQADSLRTGGTSLTLFKNGWRVLDEMGVGDDLRPHFVEIQGMMVKSDDGRELRSFRFKDEDKSQEVRPVERRVLLETFASHLPPETIRFSSKLTGIKKSSDGETVLELADGTQVSAKIVIGCDGIRSPVAKWMGFSDPNFVGHCAIRGLAYYPDGHPLEPNVTYVYGKGLRAGYVPVSSTKVYWFLCFNSPSPGPRITNPSILKEQSRQIIWNWPLDIQDIIYHTADDTIIQTPLMDRWLWPALSPSASSGSVVVVGDAWHPMTPNLGQGACCALEDSIVLAQKLASAVNNPRAMSLEDALKSYERERWSRIFPLTIRANLVGAVLQLENPIVCSVRDNVLLKLVRLRSMLEHTNFEFEPLQNSG